MLKIDGSVILVITSVKSYGKRSRPTGARSGKGMIKNYQKGIEYEYFNQKDSRMSLLHSR